MKPKHRRFNTLATTISSIVLAFSAAAAHAATISWDGSDSTAWSAGANWSGDTAPANDLVTDIASFNLAVIPNQPDAGATSVAGIQIGDGATITGALTLSGTSLTLGSGGISMLANAGAASISAPITLGAAQTWTNNSADTLSVGSIAPTSGAGTSVQFTGSGVINTTNTNTNGILGAWAVVGMAGTNGALGDWAAADGGGNVVTYTGYTDIAGATVGAGASAENWKTSNAAAALTTSATVNSLVMTTDFSVSNGATMTLGSGGMILSGISRWLKNNGDGSIAGTGQVTSGLASGELFVHSSGNSGADNDWRLWTKLVDNGGTAVKLVKSGPGFLGLQNANTHTGGTILNQGELSASHNSALGTGTLTMKGGTLSARRAPGNIELANNISVTGNNSIQTNANVNMGLASTATLTGSGTLTLGNAPNNSSLYLGATNLMSGGTIVMSNWTNSQRISNPGFGNENIAWVLSNTVANKTTLDFETGTVSFGSMTGAGRIQGNNATGIKTISAGALGLNDTFSGIIANGAGTLALTKVGSGTMTLGGANIYTGATTVTGGTLQIGNGTTGSISNNSAVEIGASGTLALDLPAGSTFPNIITGSGSLQKLGAGVLILSGSNPDFTGPTTVSAGTLRVTGDMEGSAVSLGAATLSGNGFVGPVTVNDASSVITNGNSNTQTLFLQSLDFDAAGAVTANLQDQFSSALHVENTLDVGAGFTVNVVTASPWINGETYTLITYGALEGDPGDISTGTITGLGGRQTATIGSSGSAITLSIGGDTPVWTGDQSGSWTTAEITGGLKNWELLVNGTPTDFVSNDQVIFDDTATTTDVNITDADVQVASVTFNSDTKAYTISGGGIADGSSPAGFTKSGFATVTLTNTNSFTGTTTIQDGTLSLGDGTTDGDISSSSVVVNDGTLVFNRSSGASFTNDNAISGSGDVIKDGEGTQILTGTNTYSGSTIINAGTLQVGDGGASGSLGTATVTNDANLVFNRSTALVVANLIQGSGTVTQDGIGSITLAMPNTYSGGTVINSGTILAGNDSAFGTGDITVNSGTISSSTQVSLSNNIAILGTTTLETGGHNVSLNGNLSGNGDIIRGIGSTNSIYLGGDNSAYTGTFLIQANGNSVVRFTSAAGGSANARWVNNQGVNTRASLDFAGGTIQFGSFTGTGFFTSQGAGVNTIEVGHLGMTETYSGVLNQGAGSTLAVTKTGNGTWTLTGSNTYTGDTTVNAGVLAVDGDAIVNGNKLVINGGKVDPMGATEVVDTLFFGAAQQAAGTWGAPGSGADHIDDTHFTGSGVVSVTTGPSSGYSTWATTHVGGQTADQDFNGDGVANGIAYFMNDTGMISLPGIASGSITWPNGGNIPASAYGTQFVVQTSPDLVIWTPVLPGDLDANEDGPGGSLTYTLATGEDKFFTRLVVTPE